MDQGTLNSRILYDELKFGNFSYGQKREKYDSFLFELLSKVKEYETVFDIGCGDGEYLDKYLRLGLKKDQIVAIDLAPSNIKNIKRKGFKALCLNAMKLELEDNISDFTICNGVLHHLSIPFKGFSELVRITKPGGYIYINVYNKFHPYFFMVRNLTFPIRWWYWNVSKEIFNLVYPISKILFQPLTYLAFGEFLDNITGKNHFKDQILTPQVYTFSKSDISNFAKKCNCEIEEYRYNRYLLMFAALLRVNG